LGDGYGKYGGTCLAFKSEELVPYTDAEWQANLLFTGSGIDPLGSYSYADSYGSGLITGTEEDVVAAAGTGGDADADADSDSTGGKYLTIGAAGLSAIALGTML